MIQTWKKTGIGLCFLLAGCSSFSLRRHAVDPAQSDRTPASSPAEVDEPRVTETDLPDTSAPAPALTLTKNHEVEAWISYFTGKDRDRFQRFLSRGKKYRKVIEDFLIENDLPPELYFLALIESGYQNHAVSLAKAVGVWQFIPATARRYGLQVDRYVDERRDPIRSTEAAAKYLRDLYNIFGSWPLAIAAYNAGEYRIIHAILKGKSRDYWTLCKLGVLPRETMDYVPKIIAAATIGRDPDKYDLEIDDTELYPDLEAVEVPSPIRLTDLARLGNMPLEDIRTVNPHIVHGRTPANVDTYEIWFPDENAKAIRGHLAELARLRLKTKRTLARAHRSTPRNQHIVRAGENLSLIAQKYGTTVRYLARVNGLRGGRIFPGQRLRVTSRSYHPEKTIRYRVKHGESLSRIARRFGLTVHQIKDDNSLKRDGIVPGQILIIRQDRKS